jgi:hypothetical protein
VAKTGDGETRSTIMRKRDLEAVAEGYAQQFARRGVGWAEVFESSRSFARSLVLSGAISPRQEGEFCLAVHRHAVSYGQTYAGVDTVRRYVGTP